MLQWTTCSPLGARNRYVTSSKPLASTRRCSWSEPKVFSRILSSLLSSWNLDICPAQATARATLYWEQFPSTINFHPAKMKIRVFARAAAVYNRWPVIDTGKTGKEGHGRSHWGLIGGVHCPEGKTQFRVEVCASLILFRGHNPCSVIQ